MLTKQNQVARVPVDAEAWEEVMIGLEGPNSPADRDGDRCCMTYMCCLCHGILLEKAPSGQRLGSPTDVREVRLPFGTIRTILRSDRGPEFKNILMQEYCAIMGIGRRFGTPWRPVEQGLVEGVHKETQKVKRGCW